MKAAVLHQINTPLVIEDVDLLDPGVDGVLVKVAAAAVCHTDVSSMTGALPYPVPIVLGHEGAGEVIRVGASVQGLKKGDKVVLCTAGSCGRCQYCWSGRPTLCQVARNARYAGTLIDGKRYLRSKDGKELNHHYFISCFAEYAVVPERTAIKIDNSADLSTACLFGCGASTGVGAVLNIAKVKPGSNVALFGMGGLGLSALLAAKLAGAGKIICVDILEERLKFATEIGADYTINAKNENPVEKIQKLTGGGADYSLEFAGNVNVIVQAVDAACPGGTIVVSGAPAATEKITMSWAPLLAQKVLTGAVLGAITPGVDIPRYVELMMQGKLPVDRLVTRKMPLDQVNNAIHLLEKGEVGRSVIVFGGN